MKQEKKNPPIKVLPEDVYPEGDEEEISEEALRQSHAEKWAILNASLDAIRYVDHDLRILWANQKAVNSAGCTLHDLLGQTCYSVFAGRQTPCEGCPTLESIDSGQVERAEIYHRDFNDQTRQRCSEIYCIPIFRGKNRPWAYVQIARNITREKQILNRLRSSEETLRAILSASPVGICLAVNQTIVWANKSLHAMLGFQIDTLIGKSGKFLFYDPAEFHNTIALINEADKKFDLLRSETRLKKSNGELIDCLLQASPIDPGNTEGGIILAIMDITELKFAEQKVRYLTRQLIRAQENERQMIACELHDRVAQDLTSLKIAIENTVPHINTISTEGEKVLEILEGAICKVRDLSYDLRPPDLNDIGLNRSLWTYTEDYSDRTGIDVDFQFAGMEEMDLDPEISINFYRIIQEVLSNAEKHAAPQKIKIQMVGAYPNIILRISDDGKGFDVTKRTMEAIQEKRMGIRSMEERVSLLKGEFKIHSEIGKGTRINIKIPYQKAGYDIENASSDC